MTTTCPRTGKTSYSSRAEAQKAADGIYKSERAEKKDAHRLFPYRCRQFCGKWHLSKQQRPGR